MFNVFEIWIQVFYAKKSPSLNKLDQQESNFISYRRIGIESIWSKSCFKVLFSPSNLTPPSFPINKTLKSSFGSEIWKWRRFLFLNPQEFSWISCFSLVNLGCWSLFENVTMIRFCQRYWLKFNDSRSFVAPRKKYFCQI